MDDGFGEAAEIDLQAGLLQGKEPILCARMIHIESMLYVTSNILYDSILKTTFGWFHNLESAS